MVACLRPTRPRRCPGGARAPLVGAGFALAIAVVTPARADGWGGSVALASDKVFRGISQNEGRAVVFIDLNRHTDTGWSAALGLAWPGYRQRDDLAELTLTLGKAWQLTPDWALQLGLTHYGYIGGSGGGRYDYDELSATLGWAGRLAATLALSPDTSGPRPGGGWRTDRALDASLGWHERLVDRLALDVGIGYYDLKAIRGAGYGYASAGLSWGVGPLQASLSLIASQAGRKNIVPAAAAGERWVASLVWSF